jgi:signal transduction histidine kinase/DNA-binding response OmpR family regulator
VLLDKNLDILFVNKANYGIWNWNQDEVSAGNPFCKLIEMNRHKGVYDIADVDWEPYVESRLAEIRAGDIAPREFTRQDGVTMIYSCFALSDGKRLVCYFDISAQKETENALKNAEHKAVLADRAKSEFLANMSHEIRTPMNGVLGMAELLARTELDPKQKTFTDIIVKSGNALLTIINDILDFSKIDAGQLTLDPAPFRLAEAIEDVATLVSARAQEKDLELIVRIAPELPEHVVGDVGRIRQIVTNLMGNAVKFTERGHVLVDVTGQIDKSSGLASLIFKITDTGIGIAPDKLKAVFEKFNQVDTSSTRRHEGTGLGLAISTKLVALMGGEMGASSIPGEGSSFWFTLAVPVHGATVRKKVLPYDVDGARVLIIDDNPVNRSILLEQMRSWRFDACAATGGREGIAVLAQAKALSLDVDVLILDYHMPEMNGADVARAIRNNPALSDLPVILLTSVDTAMQGAEFEGITINAHLMKPARSSLLFDTIVGVIRDARSRLHETTGLPAPKSLLELGERMAMTGTAAQLARQPVENASVAATIANKLPIEVPAVASDLTRAAISAPMLDILVAEDNAVNQIVFTQILEGLKFRFEIVDNGRKALEAMKAKSPALILMDVSMPEMNGLEATIAIREYEAAGGLTRTPIVGVTAHALKGDREKCIESGMNDYVSKPISPDALEAKIALHMGKVLTAKTA